MNDRFKFRVVRGENPFSPSGTIIYFDVGTEMGFNETDIINQCTGLKEKNGKLIYEGDIIKFYFDNDEIIGVVSWSSDYQVGFYVNTTDYFKDKYITDYELLYGVNYEVIGNIYENKELLK